MDARLASLIAGACGTLALLTGCSALQNTPTQDYVWEMGRACDSTTLRMSKVEPDGRYTVQGTLNVIDFSPYRACMDKQFRDHPYDEWLKAHQK